jgi:hypothetical protein
MYFAVDRRSISQTLCGRREHRLRVAHSLMMRKQLLYQIRNHSPYGPFLPRSLNNGHQRQSLAVQWNHELVAISVMNVSESALVFLQMER